MARIRTIKPEFTQNEDLSRLSAETHLLAAGLLCYADDEGYFNANPALVKAAIFPVRELSEDISEMFSQLVAAGYLRFGKGPDGRRYGHVVNFNKHQRVSHAKPSEIAPLKIMWDASGEIPELSGKIPESSGSVPKNSGDLRNNSALNRTELNGREEEGNREIPPTPASGGEVLLAEFSEDDLNRAWWQFRDELKRQLCDAPVGHPNFSDVVRGETDWNSCFADWQLATAARAEGKLVLSTTSPRPVATEAGLHKYSKRIAKIAAEAFPAPVEFRVAEPP